MKNFIFIVVLMLSVSNLTQADMLVSKKDSISTAIDSAEVEILYFSNSEIVKIINNSKPLNPQIQNLGVIKTTDIVVLKINDSSLYAFSPSTGESCWERLKTGVNKEDFKLIDLRKNLPVVTTPDSTLTREESIFMIDSNLSEKKSVVSTDSNLFKKESFFSTKANSPKKVSIVKKRTKKIFVLNKKESEAIAFHDSIKASVLDSLKKESIKKEGVFDTAEIKKYRSMDKHTEIRDDQEKNDHENFVILKKIVTFLFVFFMVIFYFATKEKRRIKKEAKKARKEYMESMKN